MDSLSNLALRRIPVSQIWEEGILNAPLPKSQLRQLQDRITLDNIYREGLFSPEDDQEEVDPELFAVAVEQNTPNFIWPYLSQALGATISYPTSPFDDASRDYAERVYAIEPEDYDDALDRAIGLFRNDLIEVIINTPGAPYGHGNNLIIAWAPARNPLGGPDIHKVISIRLHRQDPLRIEYFDTFDEVVNFIYDEMVAYDAVGPIQGSNVDLSYLDPEIRTALGAIRESLQINTEGLWERLEEGTIEVKRNFQLAVDKLRKGASLTVVGEFLYLVTSNPQNGATVNIYFREDGELLLTSFDITSNLWDATADPIYEIN